MPRGESLTQSTYERIRADFLACRIQPGARVNIGTLAAELAVSPGAVREALSRLTAEGLVVAEPQRGFRAADVSAADLRDLTSVRIHIELLCVRNSVAHGDLNWESRLVAVHHELTRTPEREPEDEGRLGDAWSATHAAFHEALVAACDSHHLLEVRRMLYARSERYRRLSVPLARTARNTKREHRALLEAALARDGVRAAAPLAGHLETTASLLFDALFRPKTEASAAPSSPQDAPASRRSRPAVTAR